MLMEHSHTFLGSSAGWLSRGSVVVASDSTEAAAGLHYQAVALRYRQDSDIVRMDVLPAAYLAQIMEVQQCVAPVAGFAKESKALWEVGPPRDLPQFRSTAATAALWALWARV